MTLLNLPRFSVILAELLDKKGKAPNMMDVSKQGQLVVVVWDAGRGREELRLEEDRVYELGGPAWVADLMTAKRARRREMLA